MKGQEKKDRVLTLLEAAVVLNAALVYAVSGRAPLPLAVCLVAGLLAVVIDRPAPRTTRFIVYGGVAVIALAAIENQFFPLRESRFFLPQTTLYCPLLLYASVALMFFRQGRALPPLLTSCGLLVLLLAGSTLSPPPVESFLPMQTWLATNFKLLYRTAAFIQVVAMVIIFRRLIPARGPTSAAGAVLRWGVPSVALVIVFAASMSLEGAARRLEPKLTRWYTRLLELYLRGRPQRLLFDSQTDLWQTVPFRSQRDKTVALRVISQSLPGYLRGRVYRHYLNGTWRSQGRSVPMPARSPEGFTSFTIFNRPMPAGRGATEVLTFLPELTLQTDVLFVPGRGSSIEIVAGSLGNDEGGMIAHEEWEQRAGYRVMRSRGFHQAYPLPSRRDADLSVWLGIPENLEMDLAVTAGSVFSQDDLSDRQCIAEVIDYLQQRCTYELGTRMDRHAMTDGQPMDPIMQFMDVNRKGHCELFASAATMLLRYRGIPARYVTGFVCTEPVAKHWVARLEHAHAWAEAYDAQKDQWVLVEATPPSGIPSGESRTGALGTFFERLTTWWQYFMARVRRGEIAQILAGSAVAVWRLVTRLADNPAFWGVAVALAASVLIYARRRRSKLPSDPELAALAKLLARVETVLRQRGVSRQEAETLADLRVRVREWAGMNGLEVCSFLLDYERLRYNPYVRTANSIHDVAMSWQRVEKKIKKWTGGSTRMR